MCVDYVVIAIAHYNQQHTRTHQVIRLDGLS